MERTCVRVLISTQGTRGDVQPFVALARALGRRGHSVSMCAPEGFRSTIERHGIDYAYMSNAVLELTEAVLRAPTRTEQRRLFKGFGAIIRAGLEDEWRAAQALQPEMLVYHSKALGSHHIAEKLGVAEFLAMPLPLTPTRAFPAPLIPFSQLGGWLNKLSYRLISLGHAIWNGATNDFRVRTLGLHALPRFHDVMRRRDGSPVPALYGYTAHLLPRPPDWPAHVHVTGAWFLDEADAWEAPSELCTFLERGATPVYIGFGSMGAAHAQARTSTVFEAVALTGVRAVLASGWGGLQASALPATAFMLDAAPHDWLFPRVKVVVHHGGAGSTMAGLRAGKVTVVCPFLGDQPFWGHAVHRAGVGPAPLSQRSLSPSRLAEAICSALDPRLTARAAELGDRIRAEDGVNRAVDLIEQEHARWVSH
jgi:sterol 3beta-glucosyltransferase